jgi:hypothetical protein
VSVGTLGYEVLTVVFHCIERCRHDRSNRLSLSAGDMVQPGVTLPSGTVPRLSGVNQY